MNLDAILIDPDKLRGIWWYIQTQRPVPGNVAHEDHACVRIVPHSAEFDAELARLYEPALAERRRGADLPPSLHRRLRGEAMARCVLVDWRNIEVGTPPQPVPYSFDKAVELLTETRWELFRRMVESAFANETAL